MKDRMIEQCREVFPIRLMGRCVRVSPSGYSGWVTRPLSGRAQENARLVSRMRALHPEHDGGLGSPRMGEELRTLASDVGGTEWRT